MKAVPLIMQEFAKERKIGPICKAADGSFRRDDEYIEAGGLKEDLDWCLNEINIFHIQRGKPQVNYATFSTHQQPFKQLVTRGVIHEYKALIQNELDIRIYGKGFDQEALDSYLEGLKEVEQEAYLPLTPLSFFEVAPGVPLTEEVLKKLPSPDYKPKKPKLTACPTDIGTLPTP